MCTNSHQEHLDLCQWGGSLNHYHHHGMEFPWLGPGQGWTKWAPFPPTTTIPLIAMSNPVFRLSAVFLALSQYVDQWETDGWDPSGIPSQLCSLLSRTHPALGNISAMDMLGLSPNPPSSAPPTAPSLPQEELRLLRTSFDSAFASLAGQVKELAAKVNGSGPPSKAATAKKPSAQPTPKPCAQPLTAPAPTPVSRPAPPSFASVAKAPARPLLVVALRPSLSGGYVPLAIRRSPQEVVTHLNAELVDSPHPVTLSAARWTAKNNLVVTAGPDTSAYQLMQASHLISMLECGYGLVMTQDLQTT